MTEQFFFDTNEIFKDLNPQQRKAVNCLDGALLIMAGAGSGKTRVLTCRIANLIARGVSPWNILAITFTNKAANEMKDRAAKLIGAPARDVWLSTFHSFCARILRREIELTRRFNKNFAIFDAGDSKALIRQCVKELGLDEKTFVSAQGKISALKNELITPAKYREQSLYNTRNFYAANVVQIYELYQKKLRENNALDFDDLIFVAVEIFSEFPDVLNKYQERFKYISVDEYQDTNTAQYVLTNLLAQKYQNICVVGDADQSIYGWRGADMRNILNFEEDYPTARVVLLEQNYRSTKTILNAANAVIRNNTERKPKNLWTQNAGGDKIKFFELETDVQEASAVVKEMRRLVAYENFRYDDFAVLYRTNAQSRLFEERLVNEGIPYVIVNGLKFYDRKEIKDILAYLHVIANPRDDLHLRRIINTPRRGLGATTFTQLETFALANELSILEVVSNRQLLWQVPDLMPRIRANLQNFAAMIMSFAELAKTLPVNELISNVLDETGYLKMLGENPADNADGFTREKILQDNISRKENLGTFVGSAKEFIETNPPGSLEEFLNHVALISDVDTLDEEDSRVKLMTVHAAKGLEFPVVFVVGMEDGLFPHSNTFGDKDSLEEERRACYVAITRAQKKLYLTMAKSRMIFNTRRSQDVSRFIEEIPDNCIDYSTLRAKPPQKTFSPPQPTYRPPTAYHAAQIWTPAIQTPRVDWKIGDMVNHKVWGSGMITAIDDKYLTISFTRLDVGIKKLGKLRAPITKL